MTTRINFGEAATALVVVAHPDDETIWMGGTIARFKNIKWTILALCRAWDKDRAPKFYKVCRYYNAFPLMGDFEDEGKIKLVDSVPLLEKLIKKTLPDKKYDFIFTHGASGEYGHERHIGTNRAIFNLIKAKILRPATVFCFNYKKSNSQKFSLMTYKKNSDILVKLSTKEYLKKKNIMSDIYGFDPRGIDSGYCTNPEAFKVKNFN